VTIRLILDTDIGTDVDDCLALAFIMGSPELELEGVTCVYGDVLLRARMVRKLLRLAGRPDVPVMIGASQTLLGIRDIHWEGHEGAGLLEPGDNERPPEPEHAVDFIVRTVMEQPGQIHLLAIGPLTNVALALRREPALFDNLAGLTIMGGVFRGPGRFNLPVVEHNIRCDPEAARVVLTTDFPYRLVPLDVTSRVLIRRADVEQCGLGGTPFLDAVATQLALYPRFARNGQTLLHDPLATALILQPELATWEQMQIEVETQGRVTTALTIGTTANHETAPTAPAVALDIDSARAEAFVLSRMAAQPVPR